MRNQFLLNIILTFTWVALTGSFVFYNFIFGFALSFLILWVIQSGGQNKKYFTLTFKVIGFIFFFLWELIKANIQVAYDVITPKFYMTPGIVKVPLDARSDLEITLLANLISLTPGSLSLDVSSDRKVLYVHAMYIRDRESFVADIKNGFEKRLLSILR
jgi:multicomponent Na+:H+ antiporter subunit E